MLLDINDTKTVGELQDKFNECFPYLKLVFYKKAHGWHKHSIPGNEVDASKTIGEISRKHNQGLIPIRSKLKIGLIEQVFKKHFGLFVQVHYQVNGQWAETAATDDLTLQQLCCMAEQADLQY